MRILTVTNWYPPHHRGGYEINCADVMTRMALRGHQVEVLCGDDLLPGVVDAGAPIPVHRVLKMYWGEDAPRTPPFRQQIEIERVNQQALAEVIGSLQPEVVSIWHMAALSLGLLTSISRRGLPIVYAICDSWPSYALLMDPWAKRFNRNALGRVAGRLAGHIWGLPTSLPNLGSIGSACFVSNFTREDVQANSPWKFDRQEVVPSGIDRTQLSRPGKEGSTEWAWRIVYLGRFDPRKGTETLLRSLTLLPDEAKLWMYGRGNVEERLRLERLADQLGLAQQVTFGSLERAEIGTAYREADCVVFPSEWPEPFGLVPLEAMECGTPVVATGVGGSCEFLIHEENCLLFPPGNSEALAAAIRRLADDPATRDRLKQGGRLTSVRYDIERMADAYERQFRLAIGSARRQANHDHTFHGALPFSHRSSSK